MKDNFVGKSVIVRLNNGTTRVAKISRRVSRRTWEVTEIGTGNVHQFKGQKGAFKTPDAEMLLSLPA